MTGFEPATFRTQTGRSSQAELHPYKLVGFYLLHKDLAKVGDRHPLVAPDRPGFTENRYKNTVGLAILFQLFPKVASSLPYGQGSVKWWSLGGSNS